jgi:hypothetical protein
MLGNRCRVGLERLGFREGVSRRDRNQGLDSLHEAGAADGQTLRPVRFPFHLPLSNRVRERRNPERR